MFWLFCLLVNFLDCKIVLNEVAREIGFSFLVQVNGAKEGIGTNWTFNVSFSVQFTDTAVGDVNFTVLVLLLFRL